MQTLRSQNITLPITPERNFYPPREILEDLCSRFLLNVPSEDLQSFERLLFLMEEAHWFYEDNTREKQPELKSLSLKEFTTLMFENCVALQPYIRHVDDIYSNFTAYKFQVPTSGAIILNETCDKVLLVKGWKSNSKWGFPKGKKNKEEEDEKCAIREVFEETGLDISQWIRSSDNVQQIDRQRRCRLFVIIGVPETFPFEPRTKKEISEIAWHPIQFLMQSDGNSSKYSFLSRFTRPLKDFLLSKGRAIPTHQFSTPTITTVYKVNKSMPGSPAPHSPRKSSSSPIVRASSLPSNHDDAAEASGSQELGGSHVEHRASRPPLLFVDGEFGDSRAVLPLLTPLWTPDVNGASRKSLSNFKLDAEAILKCLDFPII